MGTSIPNLFPNRFQESIFHPLTRLQIPALVSLQDLQIRAQVLSGSVHCAKKIYKIIIWRCFRIYSYVRWMYIVRPWILRHIYLPQTFLLFKPFHAILARKLAKSANMNKKCFLLKTRYQKHLIWCSFQIHWKSSINYCRKVIKKSDVIIVFYNFYYFVQKFLVYI
jgi:hypothetical protein